ncbi:MAG TPA: energy transducer TonB, partial [Pyrinomonadaceae bacterium]|nr:energy transducer TonB [Pyrinomonadaceae bacterium]
TTGRELYEARRLTEALDYLSEAEKIQSNYKDVAALIADARDKLKRERVAAFCQEARTLLDKEDWVGAESKLQTLLNLHPDDGDALALLGRVRKDAQIKNLYAEGQSYLAAARWDDALSKFLEVHRLQHDYKNVAALIAEAQSKTTERQKAAQSAALEDEARAEVGKRVADVEKLQALYGTEPDHPRAKAELRAAWQQQQLANLYAEGQRRLAANDLSGALVLFRRVREVLPDYKDVSALIAYIESRSEPPQSQPPGVPFEALNSPPSSGVPTKVKRGAVAASGMLAVFAAVFAFWPRGDEPSSRSATGNVSVADVSTPAPTEKESLPGTGTKSSGTPTASPKAGAEKSLAKATPTLAPKKAAPVAGGVLNGKAISKPVPSYPPVAKAAGVSGAVTVQIMVDESGNVISATAVGGHPLLHEAARQAALQARFSPTLLSGQPVRVSGVITYNFVLQATTTKQ